MAKVYLLTNKINSKIYIGATERTLEERLLDHKDKAKRIANTLLYRAINKYGIENFEILTLYENENRDFIFNIAEPFFIKLYCSNDINFGYNLTPGGDGIREFTPEIRLKLSESQKLNWEDPKYRSKAEKKMRSPSYRKLKSEIAKSQWSDSSNRKKMDSIMQSNEYREKMAKSCTKYKWTIETPKKEIIVPENIASFCKERQIHLQTLLARGKTKGYLLLNKELL